MYYISTYILDHYIDVNVSNFIDVYQTIDFITSLKHVNLTINQVVKFIPLQYFQLYLQGNYRVKINCIYLY